MAGIFIYLKKDVTSAPTGAPTSLSASSYGGSYADLTWTAPSDLTIIGYRISYGVNGSGQLPTMIPTNSTSTLFTIFGLEPSTVYNITVAAGNSAGFGPESAPLYIQTSKL